MSTKTILGVDIGGTGIKGAIIDINTGELVSERFRLVTPKPATPAAVAETFKNVVAHFDWKGPIGCGFPAVIKNDTAHTASNIDKSWVDINVRELLEEASGNSVIVINDADAAGIAEMTFGKGKNQDGTVILITIGTGLGSALFTNGLLVPNTELGHFYLKNHSEVAERYASNSARKWYNLEWDSWARRFDEYISHLDFLFNPDLIILGGGGSKRFDRFSHLLKTTLPIVPAELSNNAGIIGSAVIAFRTFKEPALS